MKRILLDENIPIKLLDLVPTSCEAQHVLGLGWAHMPDDALLDHAEAAGFDIVLTADQSIAHQQNSQARRISLLAFTLSRPTTGLSFASMRRSFSAPPLQSASPWSRS